MTSPGHDMAHPDGLDGLDPRVPRSLDQIPGDIPIPDDTVCVFASGSLVAGWGHTASDVDLYVVTAAPPEITPTLYMDLGLSKQPLPVVTAFGPDGVPYDVEYWTTAQAGELLDAVRSADGHGPGHPLSIRISYQDVDWFFRLSIGVALTGSDWLSAAKRRLMDSGLPLLLASREFYEADGFIEDALGLVEVGDGHSAVLAAHRALGHVVDGYLYARGSFSPGVKWRYRKLAMLPDSPLPLQAYWSLETMQGLDPDDVRPWVEEVTSVCQSLILEVDFS
jgi:hypothetical protein